MTTPRWFTKLTTLLGALRFVIFPGGKFLHTNEDKELIDLVQKRKLGGGTLYIVWGPFGGVMLQWTPFTKRLVLGWVAFSYLNCDVEHLVGYCGKSLVYEREARADVQQRLDHLKLCIVSAAGGYRKAVDELSPGDPRVGIYTGRANALEQVLVDYNSRYKVRS